MMADKMEFICNQDWNSMDVTERGRFCLQCKKEVIDFTLHSEKQLEDFKKQNGEACGMFTAEQAYDDIITPIRLTPLRKFAATIITLFALETTQAGAQQKDSVKTEQAPDWKPGGENKANICPVQEEESIRHHWRKTKLFSIGRKAVYLTKRFPFIRIRDKYVRGFRRW